MKQYHSTDVKYVTLQFYCRGKVVTNLEEKADSKSLKRANGISLGYFS